MTWASTGFLPDSTEHKALGENLKEITSRFGSKGTTSTRKYEF